MSSRKRRSTDADLDITSFMNLMVILIPFLLLNAVFTQVAVLQVSLPKDGGGAAGNEPKKPLVLEVMVYGDRFIVADRQTGPLKTIPANGKYFALAALLSTYCQDKQSTGWPSNKPDCKLQSNRPETILI